MSDRPLICNLCNGEMRLYKGPRYSRTAGGLLITAGAFSTLFWVGAALGVPMILVGLYMAGAKRQLWVCTDCHTAIEKIELKPKAKPIEDQT